MKIEMFDNRMIPEIVALWNRELAEDQISGDDFVRWHIADMNFSPDLLLVATDGGKAVGFLFGIKRKVAYYSRGTEPDKCWIKAVAVDENYQDKGIATALLRVFEEKMKKAEKKAEKRLAEKKRLARNKSIKRKIRGEAKRRARKEKKKRALCAEVSKKFHEKQKVVEEKQPAMEKNPTGEEK